MNHYEILTKDSGQWYRVHGDDPLAEHFRNTISKPGRYVMPTLTYDDFYRLWWSHQDEVPRFSLIVARDDHPDIKMGSWEKIKAETHAESVAAHEAKLLEPVRGHQSEFDVEGFNKKEVDIVSYSEGFLAGVQHERSKHLDVEDNHHLDMVMANETIAKLRKLYSDAQGRLEETASKAEKYFQWCKDLTAELDRFRVLNEAETKLHRLKAVAVTIEELIEQGYIESSELLRQIVEDTEDDVKKQIEYIKTL